MTRINLVPVGELSDQHLLAEYRELPRVVKQEVDVSDAPNTYCLGKGHVKWAKLHLLFVLLRYSDLCFEMQHRGFKVNFGFSDLYVLASEKARVSKHRWLEYKPTEEDVELSRNRLIEKLKMKPRWYKWTNREKPEYMKGIEK